LWIIKTTAKPDEKERQMATKSNLKHWLIGTSIAAAAVVAHPAAAQALRITNYSPPPGLDFYLNSPSRTGNTGVGGFTATYTPSVGAPTSFVAYCIDLSQTFSFNNSFAVTPTSVLSMFGSTVTSALDRLYTQRYATANATNVSSAAFQLAVWEIITETSSGAYSLASGLFRATGNSTADTDALNMATFWLNNLASGPSGGYSLTALVSSSHQDQLMAAPIPEPETYAMLLAGLGLMGFVVSRRRRKEAA